MRMTKSVGRSSNSPSTRRRVSVSGRSGASGICRLNSKRRCIYSSSVGSVQTTSASRYAPPRAKLGVFIACAASAGVLAALIEAALLPSSAGGVLLRCAIVSGAAAILGLPQWALVFLATRRIDATRVSNAWEAATSRTADDRGPVLWFHAAATITNTTVNSATKGSSSTRRRRKVTHAVTVVSPATPTRSESAAA